MSRLPSVLPLCFVFAGLLAACQPAGQGGESAGPSVPAVGRSVGEGGQCGGTTGITCGNPKTYCRYEASAECGAADQTGVCTPLPEVCTQQYEPVCGCDGETYGNACEAASQGVSVASQGECRSGG